MVRHFLESYISEMPVHSTVVGDTFLKREREEMRLTRWVRGGPWIETLLLAALDFWEGSRYGVEMRLAIIADTWLRKLGDNGWR